jgi:phosphatidylglycerophosphatase A
VNNVIEYFNALLSLGFGVGYFPMPGTCATLLVGLPTIWLICYVMPSYSEGTYQSAGLVLLLNFIAVGVIHSGIPYLQQTPSVHDPQIIVLDEIVGLLWVFLGIPLTPTSMTLGVLLFRFFDITKLGPIGWSEQLPGAFGIVIDDALAGIAARIILQFLL